MGYMIGHVTLRLSYVVDHIIQLQSDAELPPTVNLFEKLMHIFSFQLAWYPFDVQRCRMEFISEDVDALSVELFADPLWQFAKKVNDSFKPIYKYYSGPRKLDQYYIINMSLLNDHTTHREQNDETTENVDGDREKVVFVEIIFGRSLTSIILNIYFISFICTLVGHMTVIYRDQYFETQVSLNVTIMLVQVTIFTAVS